MINNKKDWYEGPASELSFFIVNEIIKGYSNMYKKYGIAFFNVLFHSKNNIVRMIRKKSELKTVINYIKQQNEEYIVKQLKKTYDLHETLKKKIEISKLTKKAWKEIIFLCEELWTYNLFCIYLGYSCEKIEKIQEIVNKNYELFSKVRNDICNLYILDNFLKNQKIDLSELNSKEITLFLKQNKLPNKDELKEREKEYLIFMKDLRLKRIHKSNIKKNISLYIKEQNLQGITKTKGIVAFKQNVVGSARVILKKEKLSSIKKGEILVTISTNPDYLPFLSKLAGIVTDRGGITSHAAIVAREMKIPCIVGTKIATKIFKDGDLIELDTNKGIVRKIK